MSVETHLWNRTHGHTQLCVPTLVSLTDGAVLAVPALVTLALPVLAGSVLDAERVANTLVAACSRPAFLAATGPAHAHAVGSAVH